MRISLTIGTLAAVALCAAFAVSAALAGDSAKTKVKITEGGPSHFEGKVTSGEHKCEKRRKVKLVYRDEGPYKDTVLGSAKTDANGNWELNRSFMAGLYRAVVEEKKKGSLTCGTARSVYQRF